MDYKLFNAILTMDSYNRGYNQGLTLERFVWAFRKKREGNR